MPLSELTPIFREFSQQPISFMGGFLSGMLHLNPNQDPLKSWLEQQGRNESNNSNNQQSNAPKSIEIE